MTKKQYIGGSFAPPLATEQLEQYKSLATTADAQTAEYMGVLVRMLEKFRETPDSQLSGTPHPAGRGVIVPLEDAEIQRIWDYVPWESELELYSQCFDKLPPGDLRNAAFHLLWFGRELCQDREPITNDKI